MTIDPSKLPENSTLQIRQTAEVDVAESNRTGFLVQRPGTRTWWLNGEEITQEQYNELATIVEEARQRSMRDPRWNWVDVTRLGQNPTRPEYVKGACRHTELEPVGGTVAAPLYQCGTCEAYLRTEPAPPVLKDMPL